MSNRNDRHEIPDIVKQALLQPITPLFYGYNDDAKQCRYYLDKYVKMGVLSKGRVAHGRNTIVAWAVSTFDWEEYNAIEKEEQERMWKMCCELGETVKIRRRGNPMTKLVVVEDKLVEVQL